MSWISFVGANFVYFLPSFPPREYSCLLSTNFRQRETTAQTPVEEVAQYQPTADWLTLNVLNGTGLSFQVVAFDQYGAYGPQYNLWSALDSQLIDYVIASSTVWACIEKQYGARALAGRVPLLGTGTGAYVETRSLGAGFITDSSAPASAVPQNISDWAGRHVAILNPLTSPAAGVMLNAVTALGGNLWQDAAQVSLLAVYNDSFASDLALGSVSAVARGVAFNVSDDSYGYGIVPPARAFPNSPFVATAVVPESTFGVLPWAADAYIQRVGIAMMGLNSASAPNATVNLPGLSDGSSYTISRWVAPYSNVGATQVLTSEGVLPTGPGGCVRSSNPRSDVLASITW